MPHKRTQRKRAVAAPGDQVATLGALAEALGRSDDTITEWSKRGIVVGVKGAYSVVLTYFRAKHEGLEPQLPRDPALQAMILAADPPRADDGAPLPGVSAYDPAITAGRISAKDAAEREKLIGLELENEAKRREDEVRRGQLVTKDDARAAAALVRDQFVQGGSRLSALVASKLADVKAEVRELAVAAVDEAWATIIDSIST